MALVYLKDTELTAISNAIRNKLGTTTTYYPQEMPDAILSIPVPFVWGDEKVVGDLTWWESLKRWIGTATEEELKACLGKTKQVTLTTEILETTTHSVMCVGYNCDRDKNDVERNTLTFHTEDSLEISTPFNISNAYWIDFISPQNYSLVRKLCKDYQEALPFKDLICTVSKGTCLDLDEQQAGEPLYFDETVFLPSESEMGFVAGLDSDEDKGYAASYDEFCEQNTSKTPYQYYVLTRKRAKTVSGFERMYWTRSLYYTDAYKNCPVYLNGDPTQDGFHYSGPVGFAPAFAI